MAGTSSLLNIPAADLQRCHEVIGPEVWKKLAGQRIFVTGGTGFVGKWLLATLLDADETLSLACQITVLSRDPEAFLREWPSMRGRVTWVFGDVRDFPLGYEHFDTVIHAATDVVAHASPHAVFSTCVEGTNRVLELARRSEASRLLLISSGAIYGPLPRGMTHVPETHFGGPNTLLAESAYSEGKRVSEWLVAQAESEKLETKIARVFALVGPHLPLDKHFAIGNFLGAAMAGKEIVIQGDGTQHRSYLYAADMSAMLWSILLQGKSGEAYNVGAEESISIAELAQRVCRVVRSVSRIRVRGCPALGATSEHYVPDCRKAKEQLGLRSMLTLDEAILRTAEWHASNKRN
jgi:nucleoside-diphosphate-sugar epimerase